MHTNPLPGTVSYLQDFHQFFNSV